MGFPLLSTDACTGDFTLLQMSWYERINVHCKSALASTCTLSVQGAFLLSLPDVQCNQLHPSNHYQMCSATSCIPPITTRCAVQPAASLQSLPDVQCNQLHPSNHYQMSSATSCIPPITTRCPVQPAASLQSLPDVQCNQLHPSNHYQMASATSCIPPITTRCPVQPAASLQSLPDVQCNQLHPSNHYQMSSATSCIPPITTRQCISDLSCSCFVQNNSFIMCMSLSHKYYIVYLNNWTTCLDLVHTFMCYNVSLLI